MRAIGLTAAVCAAVIEHVVHATYRLTQLMIGSMMTIVV
jgi:hypothetical protein